MVVVAWDGLCWYFVFFGAFVFTDVVPPAELPLPVTFVYVFLGTGNDSIELSFGSQTLAVGASSASVNTFPHCCKRPYRTTRVLRAT